MTEWQRGPNLSRFYDDHIPAPVLKDVVARRRSPTGLPHKLTIEARGAEEVYKYPYAKMELGDFFVVPLTGRSEKALRTGFKQAAARLDVEFILAPVQLENGRPGLRVCLTIIGVNKYKTAWEKATGKKVPISDGKWTARKRDRAKKRPVSYTGNKPREEWTAEAAFHADRKSREVITTPKEEPDDLVAVYSEPTETLTPAERRRIALAKAGVSVNA